MIIDEPQESQRQYLRELWREAFGDTEEFLDAFGQTAFSKERCRCVTTDGKVAAALYWFDCIFEDKPIAYLYAIATSGACQGRGICHELMEDTHRHLARLGYQGAVLVPGSGKLFRLYEGMGYQVCSGIREISCTTSVRKVPLERIGEAAYAKFRRKLLPERGVVQEKENLKFLQTQARLYAGSDVLLAARVESGRLYGLELLGDESKAPGIVSALSCEEGIFRVPGADKPFAMYRQLKESEMPVPSYFGLAFDC